MGTASTATPILENDIQGRIDDDLEIGSGFKPQLLFFCATPIDPEVTTAEQLARPGRIQIVEHLSGAQPVANVLHSYWREKSSGER